MIRVTLDQDSAWYLRALQRTCPRTMRAACGAAARRARRRFAKVMRSGGGMYGVSRLAPLSDVSTYLRPGQKIGGFLADPNFIVMFKRGRDEQVIGWPDSPSKPRKGKGKLTITSLSEWAKKFQESETRPMKDWEHDYLLNRGIFRPPTTYSRPERDVVNPFAADLARDWPGMVNEMFQKYYMSRRARFGAGGVR